MTRPNQAPEPTPDVVTAAQQLTSAGVPITIAVTITNRSSEPRQFVVTAVGVDSAWLPAPSRSQAVAAGASVQAYLTLRPAEGTLPARYPLAVAVQALDPASGQACAGTAVSEIDLIVDAPGQINVVLDPPDTTAVYSKRFFVQLQNSGTHAEQVHLDAHAPYSTAIDVSRGPFLVPPGSTVRVPARLTVARPSLFRRPIRHVYSVTARTSGAPRYVEGSLTARAVIGPTGTKVIAVLSVIALWVAIALIAVPKLADTVRNHGNQAAGSTSSATKTPATGGKHGSGGGKGGGGGGGTGAGPNGGGSGGGSGGGGNGGATSTSGTGSALKPKKVQFTGVVLGSVPSGVTVTLSPTTFGAPDTAGATPVGTQTFGDAPIGKLTPDAVEAAALSTAALAARSARSMQTKTDGAYSFGNVPAVGYYILQFSKPGYQTQRFVIDPTSAAAVQPMKVTLTPGTGALRGVVHNAAGGKVGGATITITDGTNTLTTSTVSKGNGIGTWSVRGLSTPSTYLVSASHDGLGVASRLVPVAAAGSRAVDLSMSSGVATLSGMVRHVDSANRNVGVGGVSISATDGTVTRTASTVTTGPQTGRFVLPDLSVGTWTVNVSAAGFQLQTGRVRIRPGAPKSALDFELTPSTATVPGQVLTAGGAPIVAAGLTLSNTTNAYKLTSHIGGAFTFDDVAPGTYTLTAEYFGYNAASMTVKAVAGAAPQQSVFHLGLHHVTNNSMIVGYAGNAISSSGSFGCDPNVDNPVSGCKVYFQLLDSRDTIVQTTLVAGQPNLDRPEVTVDKIDGPVPFELSRNLGEGDGLPPGQYKLLVSSPGFIPAKVTVQVPLNGTAALPEISLFPANVLAGQLKAVGDIDAAVSPSDGKNCMLAVPVGFPRTQLDPTHFFCDQAQADAQSTPAFGPNDVAGFAANCTFTGAPEPGVAVTTGNGVYDLRGLCDGQYKLYPIIGNSAYRKLDPNAAITQTFANGQTIEYDPQIDRLPIVRMTVKQLDDNGDPKPVASSGVSLQCGAATSTATTDGTGIAMFYGVPDGTQDCLLQFGNFKTPLGSTGRAANQQYDENATFVNNPLTLLGRIVSQYGGSDTNPAKAVTVHISALTGFIGTKPQYTSATATTNDQGCYAIVPTFGEINGSNTDHGLDCGTLTQANEAAVDGAASTTPLGAMEPKATVTVDAGLQTMALSGTTIGLTKVTVNSSDPKVVPFIEGLTALSTQSVRAAPVDLSGLSFLPATPAGTAISPDPTSNQLNFAGAVITVDSNTVHGSGTITAGVTSSGQVTWLDSAIGVPNQAWQGQYTYKLTVPGYQPQLYGTLTCGPDGGRLTCTLGDRNVVALGGLSGTVTAAPSNAAISGARVYLSPCAGSGCTVPADSSACPAPSDGYSAITGSSGAYDFSKNGERQIMPGAYRLMVCADGKITYYVNETIAGGANPAANIAMTQLGQISGTLTGNNVALSQVSITLDQCDASGNACTKRMATATTAADGTFTFADPTIGSHFLDPGHVYKISAAPVGYRAGSALVDIASKGDVAYPDYSKTFDLAALAGFSGTVTDAASAKAIPGATVRLTCDSVDLAGGTCPATNPVPVTTDSNGRFAFVGSDTGFKYFMEPGHWSVVISAPGYADNDLGSIQLSAGDNVRNGLALQLLGAVSGTVIDAVTHSAVVGARVQATCADTTAVCNALPAALIPDVATDGTGAFRFGTAGDRNVFPLVKWALSISADGYEAGGTPAGTPVLVHSGDNNLTPAFSLSPLGTLTGTLTGGSTVLNEARALNTVQVHVAQCASTVPAGSSTCATTGTEYTATTDGSGTYTVSGPNSTGVLQPGQWKISSSSTGFFGASKVVSIVSGSNTNGNLLLPYSMVDVTVEVQISGSNTMTKHARLTFTRADGKPFLDSTGTAISSLTVSATSGSSPASYLATNLVPTAYSVAISGDGTNLGNSIPLQNATVNVPLVDPVIDTTGTHNGQAPATVVLPITLISSNTLQGTVTGDYGSSTSRKLAGIEVVLHAVGPGNPIATDLGDTAIRTTTDANGNYTLGGIPNGVYTVSYNTPETGETTPDNGFQNSTSPQYSLSNNITQQADALLEPVRQTVRVQVTKTSDDDLSTGTTPALNAVGDGHGNSLLWGPLSPTAVTGESTGSTTATYTFANVPAGCWRFGLGVPNSTHAANLGFDSGAGGCASGFEVSGLQSPATDATPGYSITEHVLTIARTITPNFPADGGSGAAFTLKIHSGAGTVYTDPAVGSGSSSTTVYLVPGTYTVDLSPGATSVWWSKAPSWSYTADLTAGGDTSAAVSATETPPATLTVTTFSKSKLDPADALTVTAICKQAQDLPAGCGKTATAPTAQDSGAGVVFNGLAPGSWTITISGTMNDHTKVDTFKTVVMDGADTTIGWP